MLSRPRDPSFCSAISGMVALVFTVAASWSQDGCHASEVSNPHSGFDEDGKVMGQGSCQPHLFFISERQKFS